MSELLKDRTVAREHDIDARMFSKVLTSFVKHPRNPIERLEYLNSLCRTAHEKSAVSAIVTSGYDTQTRRFLAGPAGRRLLGQLGGLDVPPFQRVQGSTSYPAAEWIGQDGLTPLPVVNADFNTVLTDATSFGFITPISQEVTRLSDERAVTAVEAIAARGLIGAEDSKVLSTDAAVSGKNPAGLLAGAAEFSGAGSPSDLETNLELMFAHVSDGKPFRPRLITSGRVAFWMSMQRTDGGARFPDARVDGTGHVAGIPLLTSPAAGNQVILIDAAELVAVDNGLEVTASQQAAVQMDDSPTPGAAAMVSAWQNNIVFLRFIRKVWWTLMRSDAIAYTTISDLAGSPA